MTAKRMLGVLVAALVGAVAIAFGQGFAAPTQADPAEQTVSFQKQVLPIFQEHCVMCHSPGEVGYISVSLDLRSYRGLKYGSAGGIAVIPFHPKRSPLMRVLDDDWNSTEHKTLRMPPLGPKLSDGDLKTISQWIKQGAKDN